jgi:hypothetical protein
VILEVVIQIQGVCIFQELQSSDNTIDRKRVGKISRLTQYINYSDDKSKLFRSFDLIFVKRYNNCHLVQ